jgi:hypothetical protein
MSHSTLLRYDAVWFGRQYQRPLEEHNISIFHLPSEDGGSTYFEMLIPPNVILYRLQYLKHHTVSVYQTSAEDHDRL